MDSPGQRHFRDDDRTDERLVSRFRSVQVTRPPITTVARGRCTSAPALPETAIGRKPRASVVAVIITGLSRSSDP